MRRVTARLALACVRHHRLVLGVWLLIVGAGLWAVGPVMDRLDRQPWSVAAHESVRANRLMDGARAHGEQIDAVVAGAPVAGPRFRSALASMKRDVSAIDGVLTVSAPAVTAMAPTAAPAAPTASASGGRPHDPAVSADGEAALVSVQLKRDLPDTVRKASAAAVETRLREIADAVPGVEVTLGGSDRARHAVAARSLADTRRSELITLPVTLVVVYLLFGGLVAASVPLLAAVGTVVTGMLWLLLLSRWYASPRPPCPRPPWSGWAWPSTIRW
ncbi:MMPL family transporter [Streptomyces sp. ISL-86]|uniref:MMPL family transporter n=1 Tax=Streptomyces sp. ISL-86 TaxID=2819187 RepID=UPI001BE7D204|nr:MMPL family transporter [Streptomyces sp. ISL-86]MBT2457985.1 MMPL family transporter [Streptomyces sp. ISL-86]